MDPWLWWLVMIIGVAVLVAVVWVIERQKEIDGDPNSAVFRAES